jgi:hypothetical protein
VGKAVAYEGIHNQAILFDRFVAFFAQAVGSLLHLLEGCIHLLQKMQKLIAPASAVDSFFQVLPPIGKLVTESVVRVRHHGEQLQKNGPIPQISVSIYTERAGKGFVRSGYHFVLKKLAST